MKIVDANVLIYSVDEASAHHVAARQWMDNALSKAEPVVIPWLCLLAFVRIMTHPSLSASPMTVAQAMDRVDAWLGVPVVRTDIPHEQTAPILRANLVAGGIGGNLVNDAYLAALAVAADAEMVSFDRDFQGFENLRWLNPAANS